MKILTPLRFPGGKSKYIKRYIEPKLPEFSGNYYEPFLGGGSVALAMTQLFPKKRIIVNDLNCNLYIFWMMLQSEPSKLIKELKNIRRKYDPADSKKGKDLFLKMREQLQNSEDYFNVAVAYYILNKIGFSGLEGSYSKSNYAKAFNEKNIDRLKEISNLIFNFEIFNKDYKEISMYSKKHDFIFFDPPYKINYNLYGQNGKYHKNFNHEEFIDFVKNLKSKWMITYNDDESIRDAFKNYNVYNNEYSYMMQFGIDENGNKTHRKRNELLITNY